MARLEVAQQELERRVLELQDRRTSQENMLARLDQERAELRDRAELVSEKYEDVKDRGQELSGRVESVLSKLQVVLSLPDGSQECFLPGQDTPTI